MSIDTTALEADMRTTAARHADELKTLLDRIPDDTAAPTVQRLLGAYINAVHSHIVGWLS